MRVKFKICFKFGLKIKKISLWTPILLMHLGGRMTISAYNIEDNELWIRHVGVAISQVSLSLTRACT
jgi:hypothetical protein